MPDDPGDACGFDYESRTHTYVRIYRVSPTSGQRLYHEKAAAAERGKIYADLNMALPFAAVRWVPHSPTLTTWCPGRAPKVITTAAR